MTIECGENAFQSAVVGIRNAVLADKVAPDSEDAVAWPVGIQQAVPVVESDD